MHFYPHFAREDYNKTGTYVPAWRKYQRIHRDIALKDSDYNNFGQYSPAYVTTNEDWRFAMHELKPANKSILTVAASGDQPIAFAISGARDIDTFDTTYFAKVIMDIKTSAIQTMNHKQYGDFVRKLFKNKSIRELPEYEKIATVCPKSTIIAANQMQGCYIFNQGTGVYNEYMPTPTEYKIAQQTIHAPINFIWSDLHDLNTHLDKRYDIIYLSNIFDYVYSSKKIAGTIDKLKPFLNIGGQIMLYTSCVMENISEIVFDAAKNQDWCDVSPHTTKNVIMIVATRTR